MKIHKGEDGVHIPPEPLDSEFVQYLVDYLTKR